MDKITDQNDFSPIIEDKIKDITVVDSTKNINSCKGSFDINTIVPVNLSGIAFYGMITVMMIIIVFTIVCAMNGNHESIIKLIDHIIGRVISMTTNNKSFNTIMLT